jgi:hypothetical protein
MVAAEWDSNDRVLGLASSSEAKTRSLEHQTAIALLRASGWSDAIGMRKV